MENFEILFKARKMGGVEAHLFLFKAENIKTVGSKQIWNEGRHSSFFYFIVEIIYKVKYDFRILWDDILYKLKI